MLDDARWALVVTMAGLLVLGGCRRSEEAPSRPTQTAPPSAAAVLVPPEEVAQLRAAVMAAVEENRARHCPRPVLRGEALPGPADEDIEAVTRSEDPAVLDCIRRVEAADDAIKAWIDDPEALDPVLEDVAAKCIVLEPLVRRAVSHEDACSPYLAGRRGLPRLLTVVRAGKGLAVAALDLARRGETTRAVRLVLDWVRFTQDLARGDGAPLIAAAVGAASALPLAEKVLPRLVGGAQPPSAEVLAEAEEELFALLHTEPSFGSLLSYERVGMALQFLLPQLDGPGYEPPGGFDEDHTPPGDDVERGMPLPGISEEQALLLTWVALERSWRASEAACPPDADLASCAAGLERAGEAREGLPASPIARYLSLLTSPDPNRELREWVVSILGSVVAPAYAAYVRKLGERRFALAAARFQVAVLGDFAETGRCPDAGLVADAAWEPLRTIPGVGQGLAIESAGEGRLRLVPGPGFGLVGEHERAWEVEIRCPPR